MVGMHQHVVVQIGHNIVIKLANIHAILEGGHEGLMGGGVGIKALPQKVFNLILTDAAYCK